MPFVRPLVKLAATAATTAEIPGLVDEALDVAQRPHPGPTFLDFPLDQVFMEAPEPEPPEPYDPPRPAPDGRALDRAVALLRDAERPVIMAGTNLYWGHGEDALRALAEACGIPVFLNGLARGCLAADHPLFFSRARSAGLKGADVAIVVGRPDGLPAGLRPGLRARLRADRRRPRRARARAPAPGRRRALRRRRRDAADARGRRGRRPTRPPGPRTSARSRRRSGRPRPSSWAIRAPRCTRCASTRSSARCSTATRS